MPEVHLEAHLVVTIYKYLNFSGIFKKLGETDSKPLHIVDSKIICYCNGNIFIRIPKNLLESIINKKSLETLVKSYEGRYGFCGLTDNRLVVTATLCSSYQTIKENKKEVEIEIRDLSIKHEKVQPSSNISKSTYGLLNLDLNREIYSPLGEIGSTVRLEKKLLVGKKYRDWHLSADMTIARSSYESQISLEQYFSWLTLILCFATGKHIDKIYQIDFHYDCEFESESEYICEYWPGMKRQQGGTEVAAIQFDHVHTFLQNCAPRMTHELFSINGLGLALNWYRRIFSSPVADVKFLLLCTILESLNKKHSEAASTRIIDRPTYRKIRGNILKCLEQFEKEVDEANIEGYKILKLKASQPWNDAQYNQIGNLRASLKKFLHYYQVPYQDLDESLNFIKIRDKIVHEGIGSTDMISEFSQLRNLISRVFLAMLDYKGSYVESVKVNVSDKTGRSQYGLSYKNFP